MFVIETENGFVKSVFNGDYEDCVTKAKELCYTNGIIYEGDISCDGSVKRYSVQLVECVNPTNVRRFTHTDKFNDETDYLEYNPADSKVTIVKKNGFRRNCEHWTLESILDNVKAGAWKEI
jgi:hypothetical protein